MFLELELRSLTERKIRAPWATGFEELDSQADNYLYQISLQEELPLAELVFTPFKNTLWPDLWYIKLVTREKTGIIAKLAKLMRDRDINIITMDSNTTLQGKYHVSRVAVDCRRYISEEDGNHNQRMASAEPTMEGLKKWIILEFMEEIRFFEPSYPCISIERNQSLWRLHKDTTEHTRYLPEKNLGIKDGCFEIPTKIIDRVTSRYPIDIIGGRSDPQALITFDQESDLLRLIVFLKNIGIVPFTVSVKNRPGAVSAVAESLSEKDFNILASKAFSIEEERMLIWMLLQQPPTDLALVNDQVVVKKVRDILLSSDTVRGFGPRIVNEPIFQEK